MKDGFIWVYYNDATGYAVARTELQPLIDNVRANLDSPLWKKWRGPALGWTGDGIGGDYAPLAFDDFPYTILHAGAAYSSYTHKYYLAATRQQRTESPTAKTAILLYESCDGLDWHLRTPLEELPAIDPTVKWGWQYSSIVDADFTQWPQGTFDAAFYIYAGWEYDRHAPPEGTAGQNAIWRRLKLTLGQGECTCPGTPRCVDNGN